MAMVPDITRRVEVLGCGRMFEFLIIHTLSYGGGAVNPMWKDQKGEPMISVRRMPVMIIPRIRQDITASAKRLSEGSETVVEIQMRKSLINWLSRSRNFSSSRIVILDP